VFADKTRTSSVVINSRQSERIPLHGLPQVPDLKKTRYCFPLAGAAPEKFKFFLPARSQNFCPDTVTGPLAGGSVEETRFVLSAIRSAPVQILTWMPTPVMAARTSTDGTLDRESSRELEIGRGRQTLVATKPNRKTCFEKAIGPGGEFS